MLAIAGEIVIVLAAAVAGAAAGWLFGRYGRERAVAAARDEATSGTLSLADDLYARTQRLQVVEARLARAQEEFGALSARVTEADSAATEHRRAVDRLERELEMRQSQLEGLRVRIAALEELEATLAEREARIHELEGALPVPTPASAFAPASPGTRLPELPAQPRRRRGSNGAERDDLKHIPGIGPATERMLHGAGIYTFRQIANSRPEDLDAITAKLGDSPARLKRDDWIAGARREHLKKYGETP